MSLIQNLVSSASSGFNQFIGAATGTVSQLTGQSSQQAASQQAKNQFLATIKQMELEKEKEALKYSPEAINARTKMAMAAIIGFIIVLIIFLYLYLR